MGDETRDQAAPAEAPAEKGKSNALLVVLISVLVVAIAVLAIDRRARSACETAHEAVAELVEADDSPTQHEVRAALDRDPHQVYQLKDGRVVEQYVWSGAVRQYSLYTYIQPGVGDMDFVTSVTLNKVREDVDLENAELASASVLEDNAAEEDGAQPRSNDESAADAPPTGDEGEAADDNAEDDQSPPPAAE